MLRVYVANFMFCLISQCLMPSLLHSPMATPWMDPSFVVLSLPWPHTRPGAPRAPGMHVSCSSLSSSGQKVTWYGGSTVTSRQEGASHSVLWVLPSATLASQGELGRCWLLLGRGGRPLTWVAVEGTATTGPLGCMVALAWCGQQRQDTANWSGLR